MKTIEEKARAYDEVLIKAKELLDSPRTCFDIVQLKDIFPELRESEDEMIRKEIIEYFKHYTGGDNVSIKFSKWVSYLEKQKEQKPIEDVAKDITKNKESAIKFLKSANIMDDNGKLAEMYRSEEKPLEWREEDVLSLDRIVGLLNSLKQYVRENTAMSQEYKEAVFKRIEQECSFLKSLPERFNFQPKQEWSEEDENTINELCNIVVSNSKNGYLGGYYSGDLVQKLKSLRPQQKAEWSEDIIRKAVKEVGLTQHQIDWFKTNVFPPKQEWSEKDEVMLNRILESYKVLDAYIEDNTDISKEDKIYNKKLGKEETAWLQNRFKFLCLQPKQEWKEEEKIIIEGACNALEVYGHTKLANKLKSLRPYWKPSEEQVEAVRYFVNKHQSEALAATSQWKEFITLRGLLDILQKLM